jgi:hypothetical protein
MTPMIYFLEHVTDFLKEKKLLDKDYEFYKDNKIEPYFHKNYSSEYYNKNMQKKNIFIYIVNYFNNQYYCNFVKQTKEQIYDLYDKFVVYCNNHNKINPE